MLVKLLLRVPLTKPCSISSSQNSAASSRLASSASWRSPQAAMTAALRAAHPAASSPESIDRTSHLYDYSRGRRCSRRGP